MDFDPVTMKLLRIATVVVAGAVSAVLVFYYGPGVLLSWSDLRAVQVEAAAAESLSPELQRALIQARRDFVGAAGEMGILLLLVIGTAAALYMFAFAGRQHERSTMHERLDPGLQRHLDYSQGKGSDDEIPEIPMDEIGDVLAVLDTIAAEDHTVGSATKAFRERDLLPAWRTAYDHGFILESGDVVVTRLGRKARKELRRRQLAQGDPWICVAPDAFGDRQCIRLPETDVYLVRHDDAEVTAVWDMDPVTGHTIEWRDGRFHAKAAGSIFAPDGQVRIGPSEEGLTTFPVHLDDDEICADVSRPIPGRRSRHRRGLAKKVWQGSSRYRDDG